MTHKKLIFFLFCSVLTGTVSAAPEQYAAELQLTKSLQAISNNRLDLALNELNGLLRTNPNFKLAQLVKGDLLMARAGEIKRFGDATNAPSDKIDELLDEARARLQRVEAQPDSKIAPRFLWKLDAQQKYAIVVDTSRSTLYLYKNVNNEAHYVADYYVTIGKLGIEKTSEGDQRTPIGVYFVKAELSKNKLPDIYGSAAYPINYPNEWDRKNGYTGHGIWLHGTPSDTYSRPPHASDGCVVLSNDNLDKLAPYLQIGVTPVIITNRMDWETDQDKFERNALLEEIEQWRQDWASRDTDAYLKHYARNFSSDNQNLAAWSRQKKLVNSSKSWIKLNVNEVSMFIYPEQPNMVVVDFEQDYSSNNLSNRMKKRQYWIKQDNRWQIVYEGSA